MNNKDWKKPSVEKQHVLQESLLKQGQPLHSESGSLGKNYLDSNKNNYLGVYAAFIEFL